MHTYLITPHAPLLLRKGKSTRGERADDAFSFPLPGTVAGMLRTAYADTQGMSFNQETKKEIENWACGGHLLARLTDEETEALFPKPADVYYAALQDQDGNLLLDEQNKPRKQLYRLAPGEPPEDANCDLPNDQLKPVFLPDNTPPSKPAEGPTWWTLNNLTHWLCGQDAQLTKIDDLGATSPPIETRTHVKIDAKTRSGESGHLFRSTGVDFMNPREEGGYGWQKHRYALLARFDEVIKPGLVRLGSGGRLSSLEKSAAWPTMPDNLQQALATETEKFRLLLMSPAVFKNGWLPDWLDKNSLSGKLCGATVKLCAAAIPRWQPLAGWDMAAKKYKPTRRMVPAGSVYWFKIEGDTPPDWSALWLQSIGNEQQNGFGLVVPGVWGDKSG